MKHSALVGFLFLAAVSPCPAPFFQHFDNWVEIKDMADVLVIVTVEERIEKPGTISRGVHSVYRLRVEKAILGEVKDSEIHALLADRRPTQSRGDDAQGKDVRERSEKMFLIRYYLENDFKIGARYLTFLRRTHKSGLPKKSSQPFTIYSNLPTYEWSEIPIEGSTLPVNDAFQLRELEGKSWRQSIDLLLADYLESKRKELEFVSFYTSLLTQHAEQGGADQPATAPEAKPEGKEKPKPKSERRSQ